MRRHAGNQKGVSLIEALAALAVMTFGILGVVGLQVTLRANGDLSKQRAQALRLTQESVEDWRAFTTLATTAGQTAYADIASQEAATVDSSELYNTEFKLSSTVAAAPTGRAKNVLSQVQWIDRAGQTQTVSLGTIIAGVQPELAAALVIPLDTAPVSRPMGRNSGVPIGATNLGDGTSSYSPPGSTGVSWIFDNNSGIVTSVCTTVAGVTTCVSSNGFLLEGTVWYSSGGSPDITPPTAWPVAVYPTAPAAIAGTTVPCFGLVIAGSPGYEIYNCLVPMPTSGTQKWSGPSRLTLDTAVYKVCRYAPSATPTNNVDHPASYSNVPGPLLNQNFLVIPAASSCPTGTYQHQP